MIIIIALLTGAACALCADSAVRRIASLSLEKRFKDNLGGIVEVGKKGISGNVLFFAEKIGSKLRSYRHKTLEGFAASIERSLRILGDPYRTIAPYTVIGVCVLVSLACMLLAVVLLNIYNIILLGVIGTGSFFIPSSLLKDRVKAKHKAIFRQIPDVLDMLTLMVEAGLDFNNALMKIISAEKGELIREFAIAQQEVKLGKSRIESFTHLMERVEYTPLTSVLNAIMLSLKTGGNLAPTLRALSEQFRTERSQLAEKMAAEAPIKLMAPLILLIFPTIFIILFGPILLSFMK